MEDNHLPGYVMTLSQGGLDRLALWELKRLKAKAIKRARSSAFKSTNDTLSRLFGLNTCQNGSKWTRKPSRVLENRPEVQCRIFFRAGCAPAALASLKSVSRRCARGVDFEAEKVCAVAGGLEKCVAQAVSKLSGALLRRP